MSSRLATLLVALYGSSLAGPIVPPRVPQRGSGEIPGIYIVALRPGVSAAARAALVQAAGAAPRIEFARANAVSVQVPDTAALARLRNDPRVLSVYANHVFLLPDHDNANPRRAGVAQRAAPTADNAATASGSQVVPAGVARIGAAPGTLAWTGTGVGVAVVDTGLDFSHPDLELNPEIVGVNSFSIQGGSCQDIDGHGTHVAGIIAARNNQIDVVGVAPDATVYCVNVFVPDPIYGVAGSDEGLIAGLEWVAAHANQVNPPIRVVNMSLGRPATPDDTPSNPLHVIVKALYDSGISVVVSAGNDSSVEAFDMVPANYPEVMAVASTSAQDGVNGYDPELAPPCTGEFNVLADTASYFSTDGAFIGGTGVTVSAPGEQQEDIYDLSGTCVVESVGIASTWPGGDLMEASGTSMSAPHVTGVVALMWQKELSLGQSLAPETARVRIRANADRIGAAPLDSAMDGYTYDGEREGVLWAPAALGDAPPPPANLAPAVSISSPTNGATFTSATTIDFAAAATDPEQGDVSGSLIWTSSLQGQIGTGASFSRTLSSGLHTIAAAVTDAGGNVGRALVTITVNAVPQGDLAISALSAPASAAAGETITVTDTTRNQGTAAAGPTTTRFYLSPDNALDASDAPLGERPVPALSTGLTSAGSTSLTIPAETVGGTYYVIARADADNAIAETNESNNTRADSIQIGPDLVVTAVSAPSVASAGGAITVTDTTKNQGVGSAAASVTRFYLSADSALDASDPVLGERAVPSLAASQTSAGSTALTIPADTAAGTWYVIAKADGASAVGETIETNNTRTDTTQVGPDLAITALTAPTTAAAGATLTITDTAKNQGGGAADPMTTRFYLSANSTWDAADTPMGERAVAALAAGQTSSGSTSVTIPGGTAAATYYIIAKADADNAVAETSETNNTRTASIQVGPDLAVSALSAPSLVTAGATIAVTDTTKNQGAGPAGASTTRFYLSTNSVLDSGDLALAARSVVALGAGQSSAGSTNTTIPAGTAAGTYYIIAKADGDNAVAETQETNNARAVSTSVGSDLVISAGSAPTAAVAGASITISDTTKNQGATAADATTTRYYLSTNSLWDAGDVPLGERAVPALILNQTSVGSTSVTIPAGTAAATYYILTRADADGVVAESNEGNNTRGSSIKITAP